MIVQQPAAEALGPASRDLLASGAISLLVLVLATGFGWALSGRVARFYGALQLSLGERDAALRVSLHLFQRKICADDFVLQQRLEGRQICGAGWQGRDQAA